MVRSGGERGLPGCAKDLLSGQWTNYWMNAASSPDGLNGQTINTQYNGYPAIAFTTEAIRPNVLQITAPGCW
jgi:hypothetical protein